jgi:hypothetical protein
MRRQLFGRDHHSGAQLALRLDRAAARMNPFLLTLVIGLVLLNATCFIALKISPPKPLSVEAPAVIAITP